MAAAKTERNAIIIARYDAGESAPSIAAGLNTTTRAVETVIRKARKRGLVVRANRERPAILARDREIVERWNKGETGTAIGAHLGISKNAVDHALKRARARGERVEKHDPVLPPKPKPAARNKSMFGRAVSQAYARKHHPQTKGVSASDRALIDAWLKKRKPTKCPRGYADYATQPQYIQSTSRRGVQISVAP